MSRLRRSESRSGRSKRPAWQLQNDSKIFAGGWWLRYWDSISTSFWAIPGLMTLSAMALAALLMSFEAAGWLPVDWLLEAKPAAARQILATVAAAAISVAGVTFSIVIVVLTLASSQLGPRLVRSFIHDRANQVVLGVFVATFAYCVMLLGSIGSYTDSITFVPKASLALAIVLALLDIAVFIYFIHHLAVGIQSPQVIYRVGEELDRAIDQCFGEKSASFSDCKLPEGEPILIASEKNGYVHGIDINHLLKACDELNVRAECLVEVGEFILFSAPMLKVWRNEGDAGGKLEVDDRERLLDGILLAAQRSPVQDPTFAMNQLVEIAVRSLSPGINDPFTAMNAANRMAAALVRVDQRINPQSVFGDEQPSVWVHWRQKEDYVDTMFAALTEYAGNSVLVNQHLLSLCDRLLARLDDEHMRGRLGYYARAIIKQVKASSLPTPDSVSVLQKRIEAELNGLSVNKGDDESSEDSADTGTTGD